jgi:ABC-type glycerol-3-phosphate transport system substrate-binding protein
MRLTGILSLVFGAIALAASAQAQVPAGYPADYKAIVDGAKKEGKVVVYSTTDAKLVTPLIKDFEAAFPGVKVEYTDLNSTEVYNRYISESAANAASADAVWSSSMDLQMKLAADGLAAPTSRRKRARCRYGRTGKTRSMRRRSSLSRSCTTSVSFRPKKCRRRTPTWSSC